MNNKGEERFVPVPINGFRKDFEMCASGFVRRKGARHSADALIWLVPHRDGVNGRAVYRLCLGDRRKRFAVDDVFLFFGRDLEVGDALLSQMRNTVRFLNRRDSMRVQTNQEHIRMREREAQARGLLYPVYRMKGCPWARGEIHGEAFGADPVLGF